MAKAITQFEADDGSIHTTIDEAMAHDRKLVELAAVMADMPPVHDPDLVFANGGGYKDWPIHIVNGVRAGLMRLLRAWAPDLFRAGEPGRVYIGRWLFDCDTKPGLYAQYMRLFFNIDEAGREYGQPYYRNLPGECGKRVFG